jgi:hypothetical protein
MPPRLGCSKWPVPESTPSETMSAMSVMGLKSAACTKRPAGLAKLRSQKEGCAAGGG